MMLPLVHGILGAGSNLPFHPSQLYTSGQQGAWYDPTDISTLFQDAAGTTPVTTNMDKVGLMLDKSGNDNHITFSDYGGTDERPNYITTGIGPHLSFGAGNNHLMDVEFGSLATQPCVVSLAMSSTNGGSRIFITGYSLTDRFQMGHSSTVGYNMQGANNISTPHINTPYALDVYTGVFNGASSSLREGLVEVASGDCGAISSDGISLFGHRTLSSNDTSGDFHGLIYAEDAVGQLDNIEAWLNAVIGN